jgi:hypothetical protein
MPRPLEYSPRVLHFRSFVTPVPTAPTHPTSGAPASRPVRGSSVAAVGAAAASPSPAGTTHDSSTLLNAITARTGLLTFHGFELLDFSRHEMPYTAHSIKQVCFDQWSGEYHPNLDWRDLEGDETTYRGWREIKPGRADGIAVGGNSEAFMQLAGTKYCPPLDGSILFLGAYRLQKRHIQALLATLMLKGVFASIRGLIIGYCPRQRRTRNWQRTRHRRHRPGDDVGLQLPGHTDRRNRPPGRNPGPPDRGDHRDRYSCSLACSPRTSRPLTRHPAGRRPLGVCGSISSFREDPPKHFLDPSRSVHHQG